MRFRTAALVASMGAMMLGVFAQAQGPASKPGLYEITTAMTWQQTPFPAGMQLPPAAMAAFNGTPHAMQVCLTQQMIDRYGAPMPQNRAGCQYTNIQKGLTSVSGDLVCTGAMSGKGTVNSSWSADGTVKSKVHFQGTMQMGPNATPVEWTSDSTSVYKGADCGSVKPLPMPSSN